MTKRQWKDLFSKFIVFLVIALNTGFAYGVLKVFATTAKEPTVLIGAWFTFTTGEVWLLADIKKKKMKKEESANDSSSDTTKVD